MNVEEIRTGDWKSRILFHPCARVIYMDVGTEIVENSWEFRREVNLSGDGWKAELEFPGESRLKIKVPLYFLSALEPELWADEPPKEYRDWFKAATKEVEEVQRAKVTEITWIVKKAVENFGTKKRLVSLKKRLEAMERFEVGRWTLSDFLIEDRDEIKDAVTKRIIGKYEKWYFPNGRDYLSSQWTYSGGGYHRREIPPYSIILEPEKEKTTWKVWMWALEHELNKCFRDHGYMTELDPAKLMPGLVERIEEWCDRLNAAEPWRLLDDRVAYDARWKFLPSPPLIIREEERRQMQELRAQIDQLEREVCDE